MSDWVMQWYCKTCQSLVVQTKHDEYCECTYLEEEK